jgi:hypothetical protein
VQNSVAVHPPSGGLLIKGVVCGAHVADDEGPLMQRIRYRDKPVDELVKGKPMETILRQ